MGPEADERPADPLAGRQASPPSPGGRAGGDGPGEVQLPVVGQTVEEDGTGHIGTVRRVADRSRPQCHDFWVGDPATRLLRLLGLLLRRPEWTGPELAERLEVDPRTVRRDVGRLRSVGYQIDGVPGVAGGYRLRGGNDVPPLLFEDDEAVAVAVVLGASAGAAVPGIERGALTALRKLDRLLPPRLRSPLASLRAATESLVAPTEAVSAECLVSLAEACDSHLRVTFTYVAQDGHRTERRAEPYRLVATDRRWYLAAYDLDRDDWRTFRVDRASGVQVTGHVFEPRDLADPAGLVAEAISAAPYTHRAVVAVEGTAAQVAKLIPAQVGMVAATDPGPGAEAVGDASPRTTVELGVDNFDWLASYLVGLGVAFEVVGPPEIRAHLAAVGERLWRAHGAAVSGDPRPAG